VAHSRLSKTNRITLPYHQETQSSATFQQHLEAKRLIWTGPLLMVSSRLVLFAVFQAAIAGIFILQGVDQPWASSTAWWPVTATLTNLTCLFLLDRLMRLEGLRLQNIYHAFDRRYIRQDILVTLGLMVLCAPFVMLPSNLLGTILYGDANLTFEMMFRPLPLWASWIALTLFPVTIAFAELPTYFAYVMPRLSVLSGRAWFGVLVAVVMLSFQHATLPLIFDWRFILWRLFMFLGFALLIGLCLNWRPRLLPYLMVIHGLLDFATAWMVFSLPR
jgi:hypothetical protein